MAGETCFIKYVKWGISLTFLDAGATYILSVVIHSFFPRRRRRPLLFRMFQCMLDTAQGDVLFRLWCAVR